MAYEDFGSVVGAIDAELPIDSSWRNACRARIKSLKSDQYELADHIGASQSGVSQVLSEKKVVKTTKLAHAISLALQVPLPLRARALLVGIAAEQSDPAALDAVIEGMEKVYGVPGVKAKKDSEYQ